eukprot:PLAT1992.1.p1 GENE.PLAT1992.1~~PLAT1992.1.p1  ORF type:complete len:432 (-),score=190.58 PLAT1992.1:45-1340(-)
MSFYAVLLVVLTAAVAAAVLLLRQRNTGDTTGEFRAFQTNFLLVYLLVMAADWLQGPYLFVLYRHYGFTLTRIATLFTAGFVASMLASLVVGASADRFGRRRHCLLFIALYTVSCLTKHVNSFAVLIVGRCLSGIGTSILFSAFEAWMLAEHKAAAYPIEWLDQTFAQMALGNGLVAIAAGIIAGFCANNIGYTAPFDLSIIALLPALWLLLRWPENQGDRRVTSLGNLAAATKLLRTDRRVLLLGLVQSTFEGVMYVFVLLWTPALERHSHHIPHGLIFSSFMLCTMLGSYAFKLAKERLPIASAARYLFVAASLALSVPVATESHYHVLLSFCMFELCCGMFYPSVGKMRAELIPDDLRATVMNVFRVPLNLLVVLMLETISLLSIQSIFFACAALLMLTAYWQHRLYCLSELATEEARARAAVALPRV